MGLITFEGPSSMDSEQKRKRIRALAQGGRLFHESGEYEGGAPPVQQRLYHESGDYQGGSPNLESHEAPEGASEDLGADEEPAADDQGDEEYQTPRGPFRDYEGQKGATFEHKQPNFGGKDMVDVYAEGAGLDKLRRRADAIRGIAEGLGTIGQTTTAGDILLKTTPRKPFVAESSRRELKDLDEQVRPEEAAALRQIGIQVPEGARMSYLKQLLPSIGTERHNQAIMAHTQAADAAAQTREEQADRRIKNQEQAQAGREERAEKRYARVEHPDRLELEGYDYALKRLPGIREKIKATDFAGIGPVTGRIQEFARKLGLANPEAVKNQADLVDMIAVQAFGAGGKQLTDRELELFKRQLPQVWDSPEQLEALMDEWENRIKDKKSVKLKSLKGSGFDVSPYESAGPAIPGAQKVRIPAGDKLAIQHAQEDGLEVETY